MRWLSGSSACHTSVKTRLWIPSTHINAGLAWQPSCNPSILELEMGSMEKTGKLWVHLRDCSRKTPEYAHASLIPHTQVRGLRMYSSVVEFLPVMCKTLGSVLSTMCTSPRACVCTYTEIYLGVCHLLKCENEKKLGQVTTLLWKSNISPPLFRNYLLSSSEDGTVRLWSLQTFTCLVGYKGHNYPVWDTQFSPYGYYFVSGGHDRVAR